MDVCFQMHFFRFFQQSVNCTYQTHLFASLARAYVNEIELSSRPHTRQVVRELLRSHRKTQRNKQVTMNYFRNNVFTMASLAKCMAPIGRSWLHPDIVWRPCGSCVSDDLLKPVGDLCRKLFETSIPEFYWGEIEWHANAKRNQFVGEWGQHNVMWQVPIVHINYILDHRVRKITSEAHTIITFWATLY